MSGRGCVLIVDDEELVVNVAQASLEGAGYSVLTAMDGERAVEVYREHCNEIAAVLLDLTLPKMNGEEVFRQMKTVREDAVVVVSSGHSEQETAGRFGHEAPTAFLKKPFRPRQLIDKMQEVTGS